MNPTEQHERQTAVTRLDKRIDDLAAAVDEEVAERLTQLRTLITRLTATDRAERLVEEQASRRLLAELAESNTRNAANIIAVNYYLSQLVAMGFVERLRWLLLGRLPEHFLDFATDPESVLFPDPNDAEKLTS